MFVPPPSLLVRLELEPKGNTVSIEKIVDIVVVLVCIQTLALSVIGYILVDVHDILKERIPKPSAKKSVEKE